MSTVKAVKKPAQVEAVQWTGDNYEELREFTKAPGTNNFDLYDTGAGADAEVWDEKLLDWVSVNPDDWIIMTSGRCFHKMGDADFLNDYEVVS